MELLVCEKCDSIVYPWSLHDSTIHVLPHHRYFLLGKKCLKCGHDILKRRWSMDYVLREQNEGN